MTDGDQKNFGEFSAKKGDLTNDSERDDEPEVVPIIEVKNDQQIRNNPYWSVKNHVDRFDYTKRKVNKGDKEQKVFETKVGSILSTMMRLNKFK